MTYDVRCDIIPRKASTDLVVVTKEDVDTLKNDWLTDNVLLFHPYNQ